MGKSSELLEPEGVAFLAAPARVQLVEFLRDNRQVARRDLYLLAHQVMVELVHNIGFTPPGVKQNWTLHPESGVANSSPLFKELCSRVYETLGTNYSQLTVGNLETLATEIQAQLPQDKGEAFSLR